MKLQGPIYEHGFEVKRFISARHKIHSKNGKVYELSVVPSKTLLAFRALLEKHTKKLQNILDNEIKDRELPGER